jgi:hypothetical protein
MPVTRPAVGGPHKQYHPGERIERQTQTRQSPSGPPCLVAGSRLRLNGSAVGAGSGARTGAPSRLAGRQPVTRPNSKPPGTTPSRKKRKSLPTNTHTHPITPEAPAGCIQLVCRLAASRLPLGWAGGSRARSRRRAIRRQDGQRQRGSDTPSAGGWKFSSPALTLATRTINHSFAGLPAYPGTDPEAVAPAGGSSQ